MYFTKVHIVKSKPQKLFVFLKTYIQLTFMMQNFLTNA